MASEHRPHAISLWIKNARRWDRVVIADIDIFVSGWFKWWWALQPGERMPDVDDDHYDPVPPIAPSPEMDWAAIAVPGINGILSFVAGLAMWGMEVQTDRFQVPRWLKAVRDVCLVLEAINILAERTTAASSGSKAGPTKRKQAAKDTAIGSSSSREVAGGSARKVHKRRK